MEAGPPPAASGIIRIEVPVRQRGDAVEWLHAQGAMPRCFFSARAAPLPEWPDLAVAVAGGGGGGNGNGAGGGGGGGEPVSVAGVGSAVFFRGTEPFSLRDWHAIKRFLPRDCPLIRAYGTIRFDATSDHSVEWEEFGSFYFVVPQVEFNELEDSSVLATTIAWDDSLSWTWHNAVKDLQSTLQKISSSPIKVNNSTLQTTIVNLNHVPTKASWDLAVTKALQMIKGKQRELVKVVLARCSRYITDTCIDPVELLACLKPEQLFHRKYLNISSEALAGTRARGKTRADDFQIGQDLLLSTKEDIEFTIMICDDVVVHPSKALRKLPRVQHLSAQLAARIRNEGDEKFLTVECMLDLLVGLEELKGHSTLVYAGAGIVEGTNPSFEWDELDLKASQCQEQHICLQEAENMGTESTLDPLIGLEVLKVKFLLGLDQHYLEMGWKNGKVISTVTIKS
uniref:Chorismate-utilising enzyme C-terminal domain-containing protein n=1 Tax=Leersia perrieri TaxID=77586 RepID=A0A0D9XCX6_9ORYZ